MSNLGTSVTVRHPPRLGLSLMVLRHLCCSLYNRLRYASDSPGFRSSWFTTRCRTATSESVRAGSRRSVSAAERSVAMDTTTNSALSGLCNSSSNLSILSRNFSASYRTFVPPFLMSSLDGMSNPSCPARKLPACPTTSNGTSILPRRDRALVSRFEMNLGYSSSLIVCPVGAVSMTMRSKEMLSPIAVFASPSSTKEITLESATSSSAPGGGLSKMSVRDPKPNLSAIVSLSAPPLSPPTTRLNSATESSRSTSSPYSKPPCSEIGVTLPLERSVVRASPRECAGSVEITRVRRPSSASLMAIAALVLVLPTPPFPPTST
mmetsp:Transcript_41566/g.97017  ORF Transcript_41566/g.97017 Transcript_41566/m.97017 type:complete len:321 (+) Transcript_41566:1259-2221(+)